MKIINLSKEYENGKGVFNISLDFYNAKVYAIMGHNGSGKTSLFRVLSGLLEPSEGEIFYRTVENISYIPENRALYLDMTIKEHLEFIGKIKKMSKKYFYVRYKTLMNQFYMWQYENNLIQSLSKGNQQKVQFMVALLTKPDLLILDEPFTGLDVVNVKLLKEILTQCSLQGTKIMISSHQYEEIEDFADHILLLKEGETVLQGSLKSLRESHDNTYVSVGEDHLQKYANHESVISVETYGHTSRYKIKPDVSFLETVIKNRKTEKVIIENISIKDLVAKYYE